MKQIKKRTTHAFGKKVYLLGVEKDGTYVWLEAPHWDWVWCWGFGYIETYTNNKNPQIAKDISSHSHWDSSIVGKPEYYDYEKKCFRTGSNNIDHLNGNPKFNETVLTDSESWELSDLMRTFYTLKETSRIYHRGSSNIASTKVSLKNKQKYDSINKVELPEIFKRIDEILTPESKL